MVHFVVSFSIHSIRLFLNICVGVSLYACPTPFWALLFSFLNSRTALFKKLLIFPPHFSSFHYILMSFRSNSVFFSEWLRYIPHKFRQGWDSSTDMEPIHWFQAHHTISSIPLGQHFTHPAGSALLLSLFDPSRDASKLHAEGPELQGFTSLYKACKGRAIEKE